MKNKGYGLNSYARSQVMRENGMRQGVEDLYSTKEVRAWLGEQLVQILLDRVSAGDSLTNREWDALERIHTTSEVPTKQKTSFLNHYFDGSVIEFRKLYLERKQNLMIIPQHYYTEIEKKGYADAWFFLLNFASNVEEEQAETTIGHAMTYILAMEYDLDPVVQLSRTKAKELNTDVTAGGTKQL